MKRSFILIMALAVILTAQQVTLPGEPEPTQPVTPVTPTQPVTPTVPVTPIVIPDEYHVIQPIENGEVDWTEQVITAKGMAVIDTATFPNYPQAYAMAVRGATVVAQRNLLETIKGVRVVSETKVVDMMTTSDYVYTRVDGVVRGARPLGEPIERNGLVEVTLEIPLYDSPGLAPAIFDPSKFAPVGELPQEALQALQAVGGIVIDASGTDIEPNIFPRFVDEEGNVILDLGSHYSPSDPRWANIIRYVQAEGPDALKKLGIPEDSWVIKAIGSKDGNLVIPNEKKKKMQWLQDGLGILLKLGKIVVTAL